MPHAALISDRPRLRRPRRPAVAAAAGTLALALGLVLGGTTRAADPAETAASRPATGPAPAAARSDADPRPPRARRRGGEEAGRDGPDREDREDRRDRPDRREPSDEEWQQTLDFLREHSPRRMELYQEYAAHWQRQQADQADPQNPGRPASAPASRPASPRMRVRASIFGRVQEMRDLQGSDPALHEFVLSQFRLEDQVIGGLIDARDARRGGDPAAAASADAAVDAAVRQYVENAYAEREARIERLRQDLAKEEQRLDRDRGRADEMMEHLRARYERYVPDESPPDGPDPSTRPAP